MSDPIVATAATIKNDLHVAKNAGELKDGNVLVRNIWEEVGREFTRQQLPLVEFESLATSGGRMVGEQLESVPFSFRFICWVASGPDERSAKTRCYELRDSVRRSLYSRRAFSGQGGAQQGLTVSLEDAPYNTRFAYGLGMTISGDILRSWR